MRRVVGLVSVFILGVALAAVVSHGAVAQEKTPPFLIAHPLVGAWEFTTDSTDASSVPQLVVFSADGTATASDPAGCDTIGTWQATGPQTAAITLVAFAPGEGGAFGETSTVRGTIDVAADDQRFTATYTQEFVGSDGVGFGEVGPTIANGKRIIVEPMGTPISAPAV